MRKWLWRSGGGDQPGAVGGEGPGGAGLAGTGDALPPCLDMADPSQNASLTPPGCVALLWGHTVPRFLPSRPVSLVTQLPPPLA